MAGRPRKFDEEQVLDRALDLFWKQGYAGTSMQDLLDCMGINRQSLYNTFGDKRQLFLRVLERYRRRSARAVLALLQAEDASLPAIHAFFDGLTQSLAGEQPKACLMGKCSLEIGDADAEIAGLLKAHMQELEDAFEAALRRAVAKGELRELEDPHAMACLLTTTTHGLGVLARAGVAPDHVRDTVRAVLATLR